MPGIYSWRDVTHPPLLARPRLLPFRRGGFQTRPSCRGPRGGLSGRPVVLCVSILARIWISASTSSSAFSSSPPSFVSSPPGSAPSFSSASSFSAASSPSSSAVPKRAPTPSPASALATARRVPTPLRLCCEGRGLCHLRVLQIAKYRHAHLYLLPLRPTACVMFSPRHTNKTSPITVPFLDFRPIDTRASFQ